MTNIWNLPIPAYRCWMKDMIAIEIEENNDSIVDLASLPLIVPPGRYRVNLQTYDMTNEGLYRFTAMNSLNGIQRIVYQSDPLAIINGVQWITSQSYLDNSLTYPQMTIRALNDKLRISCGYATLWCKSLLDSIGIPSRMVNAITAEQWWYTTNDGHALLEVWLNGKWVAFDFSFNVRFWKDGLPLNLLEVSRNIPDGYEIERMTTDTSYDVSGMIINNRSISLMFEPLMQDNFLRDYYARLFQIPLVFDGGKFFYFRESQYDPTFTQWGYIKLSEADYLMRFYS